MKVSVSNLLFSLFALALSTCGQNRPEKNTSEIRGTSPATTSSFTASVSGRVKVDGRSMSGAKIKVTLKKCTAGGTTGQASTVTSSSGEYQVEVVSTNCTRTQVRLSVCASKSNIGTHCRLKKVTNGQSVVVNFNVITPPACNSCTYQWQCFGLDHCINGCCEFQPTNRCFSDFDCFPGQCESGVCR